MGIQQLCWAQTGTVKAGVCLLPGLCQMQLHTQLLLQRIGAQRCPEAVVTGVFGVDAGIDANAAVVEIVPFFRQLHQLSALFVGFKVEVLALVDKPVGRECDVCLDAALCRCRSGGFPPSP